MNKWTEQLLRLRLRPWRKPAKTLLKNLNRSGNQPAGGKVYFRSVIINNHFIMFFFHQPITYIQPKKEGFVSLFWTTMYNNKYISFYLFCRQLFTLNVLKNPRQTVTLNISLDIFFLLVYVVIINWQKAPLEVKGQIKLLLSWKEKQWWYSLAYSFRFL